MTGEKISCLTALLLLIIVESMWRLGLSGVNLPYPERPGEPDCSYYMRTGSCSYGPRCRFNHPRDHGTVRNFDFVCGLF